MKQVLLKFLLLMLIGTVSSSIWGQTKKISGKINDEDDNNPLVGVNVSIKGKSVGVLSDLNGFFTINTVPGDILIFSFTGYSKKEVLINDANNLLVSLKSEISKLEDVIVVMFLQIISKKK